MHVSDDFTGLQELSMGVTSVRDPGNSDTATLDRAARRAKGQLLSPHVYASSLIDGKGPYTAQVANVATSQDEAIALIDKAKAGGFTGIKFYGTFNPAWLKASIAEAHRLGLHVHGHIPAGIRPMDAIDAGYDEITHINWIVMQAVPDSVIAVSNGIARFEGPGRFAKDLDVDAGQMKTLVSTMAAKHIVSDPTMVAFESLYVPENGDLSPSYAPFVGTLPPATERGFRQGGFAVPEGSDARGLSRELGEDGAAARRDAPRGRADRRRHGRLGDRARARARNLRRGRVHAGQRAGGGDHRAGAAGRRREAHGVDRRRQGGRPAARRRRSLEADRRPAPHAARHADGCGLPTPYARTGLRDGRHARPIITVHLLAMSCGASVGTATSTRRASPTRAGIAIH